MTQNNEKSKTKNFRSKIDSALSKNSENLFILKQRRVQFKLSTRPDRQQELLKRKYAPINNPETIGHNVNGKKNEKTSTNEVTENEFIKPSAILFRKDRLNLTWNNISSIGSGLSNLGNTCFLNSVLQCLTYTPPLTNLLLSHEHGRKCKTQQFCMMCELEKHVSLALGSGKETVIPRSIASRIKNIAKHMRIGRQEDAHEFLRFVIEGLQNSVLHGYEKLENRIKETNMIYQIFGGYLQSQVRCLECKHNSNTFDPCLDICLDIKGCDSVKRAFEQFVKPEVLSKGNRYKCERCRKLVNAQKQITLYQAPNILTIQLKRFDFARSFYGGGKIGKVVDFDEVLRLSPYMSKSQNEAPIYHLYAVLVHYGSTCNSGHYFCFVKNSNGVWYEMNDSCVRQVSVKTVLKQPAYILFYVRDPASIGKIPHSNMVKQENKNLSSMLNMITNKKRKLNETSGSNEQDSLVKNKKIMLTKPNGVSDQVIKNKKISLPKTSLSNLDEQLLKNKKQQKPEISNTSNIDKVTTKENSNENANNKINKKISKDSITEEIGVPISRKKLKKLKKAKLAAEKANKINNNTTSAKQSLLDSLLKSTTTKTSASETTKTESQQPIKLSKSSSSSSLERIISNTYNPIFPPTSSSFPISTNGKNDLSYKNTKSHQKWSVSDISEAKNENTTTKSIKSAMNKIGNWIIKEKEEAREEAGQEKEDDIYTVKNIRDDDSDRENSNEAPLVQWDEKLESKQEKLDRVIELESKQKSKSGAFELEKSEGLFGANVSLWGEDEVKFTTVYERDEFLESTRIKHKKPDNWDLTLDAGKVKKTKKQKMEKNGDPRVRQEFVHQGFRRLQEEMNKKNNKLEEVVKIKSTMKKKKLRKMKNKNRKN